LADGNESLKDELTLLRQQITELMKCHDEQCDRRHRTMMVLREVFTKHRNTITNLEGQLTDKGRLCENQSQGIHKLKNLVADKERLCEHQFQEILKQKRLVEYWVKQHRAVAQEKAVLTKERDSFQSMLVTQMRLIREANENRFKRIRELHTIEIRALVDRYECQEIIKLKDLVAEKDRLCANQSQEIIQQKNLVEHWVKQYRTVAQQLANVHLKTS
jgi:hypothetical protein